MVAMATILDTGTYANFGVFISRNQHPKFNLYQSICFTENRDNAYFIVVMRSHTRWEFKEATLTFMLHNDEDTRT